MQGIRVAKQYASQLPEYGEALTLCPGIEEEGLQEKVEALKQDMQEKY